MNIHLAPWSSGQDATLSRSNQGFDSPGGQPIKAFNREVEEYKMLVSATEMLKKAKAGHYAVGQFNINDLEWTKAVLTAAEELRSPVILGVSEGAGKYMAGYRTVVGMVNGMIKEMDISVPVALHLDHGSYEGCLKCIDAGFSSVMFDGSHYPIEENIEKTTTPYSSPPIEPTSASIESPFPWQSLTSSVVFSMFSSIG